MKIIDAHTHATFGEHYREEYKFGLKHGIDTAWESFQKELNKNKVVGALIFSSKFNLETPVELEHLTECAKKDNRLFPVCAVNPEKVSEESFEKFKKALKDRKVYGIKIFLGYYPYYATDEKYARFYKLAEEYDCPVIFHTGDTFGNDYLIKYTQPLQIDEVAVKYRNTKFVIAHLGNPWIRDSAEVLYKNPNVFADISAFRIGTKMKRYSAQVINDIRYVMDFIEDSSKLMYGSDWPLAKMQDYLPVMKHAIPKKYHNLVFYKNAKKLFQLPV